MLSQEGKPEHPEMSCEVPKGHAANASELDVNEALELGLLQELLETAFLDPGELFDERGHLRALEEMPVAVRKAVTDITVRLKPTGEQDENGRPILKTVLKVKFRTHKLRALNQLTKHVGLFRRRLTLA